MHPLSTYETDELARLTNLTLWTMRPGEYVVVPETTTQWSDFPAHPLRMTVWFRTTLTGPSDVALVSEHGATVIVEALFATGPLRRVVGFPHSGHLMYLDPPLDDMRVELQRRTTEGDELQRPPAEVEALRAERDALRVREQVLTQDIEARNKEIARLEQLLTNLRAVGSWNFDTYAADVQKLGDRWAGLKGWLTTTAPALLTRDHVLGMMDEFEREELD